MKFAVFAACFLTTLGVSARPSKRVHYKDADILNYALTLEHLENNFYSGALAKFDQKAFTDAGLPSFARGRFQQIADHENAHVQFLTTALKAAGAKPVQPCNYSFPYTSPSDFSTLSQILEGVGVSAYAGAARFIKNGDYLTAAAVVLSTEARHASFVAAAVNNKNGWSGPLDVPLPLNQVYTLAAAFITGCPSDNPVLPLKAYPKLTLDAGKPGDTVSVTIDPAPATGTSLNIAFYTGLSQLFAPVQDGKVTIPTGLYGTIYAVATTVSAKSDDYNTAAGPAILVYPFDENDNYV